MSWFSRKIKEYNDKIKLEEFNANDVRKKQERLRGILLNDNELTPLLARIDQISEDPTVTSCECEGLLSDYTIHELYVRKFSIEFKSDKTIISWN